MEEEEKPPMRYREALLSAPHLPIAPLLVEIHEKTVNFVHPFIVNDSHRALSTTGTSTGNK